MRAFASLKPVSQIRSFAKSPTLESAIAPAGEVKKTPAVKKAATPKATK